MVKAADGDRDRACGRRRGLLSTIGVRPKSPPNHQGIFEQASLALGLLIKAALA